MLAACCWAVDIDSLPKPTGYVSDLAHVINSTDKDKLEAFCTQVEQQLGVELALVTIDTIGDQPTRDFAFALSRKWGVGDRKTNQGVLLLVVVKDHKLDIETGRGIEPYLTDGFSGSTLRSMRPDLRANDYGAALQTAAQEMASQIAQGKQIPFSDNGILPRRRQAQRTSQKGGVPFSLIVVGIFFLLWLLGRGGRRGGGGPRYRSGGGGSDFLTGMVIGDLLGGGGRSSGGWGGGGFGGDSGGNGGFGGFGGGDFGGGGASSDW